MRAKHSQALAERCIIVNMSHDYQPIRGSMPADASVYSDENGRAIRIASVSGDHPHL